ncbi:Uncharacterised protein [Mycobacteroides abscessus subsp. abscessus]|nr:Uncharacterised protein [Mycobacteroides abscessus subsp. abscessus]
MSSAAAMAKNSRLVTTVLVANSSWVRSVSRPVISLRLWSML